MEQTARQFNIHLSIFLQPAPALYKTLTPEEKKVVGDLSYEADYRLFTDHLLKSRLPVYSLLKVFMDTPETIYKDGIHVRKNSTGSQQVVSEIFQILDQQ
jgi:hypothetical protein